MAGAAQLRELVNERLAAAAEQIFGLVEKTIGEYQEEVVRSRKEVIQLRKQLQQLSVLKAEVRLTREGTTLDTEDISPSQQPDQLPSVEEEEEEEEEAQGSQGSQYVKDELLDVSISPHATDESSHSVKDGYESESTRPTDYQRFPAFSVSVKEEWNRGGWGLLDRRQGRLETVSMDHEQTPAEKRVCRVCGRMFSRDCDLIRHMDEVHMGERAFKCSGCGKEFARRNHLAIHLRIHTGERPHTCPFCKKSFAQRSNLNVHLRTHTGEKPYFCKTCGKMVAHSYHLKTCSLREARGKKLL